VKVTSAEPQHGIVELPPLRRVVSHAGVQVLEGTILPTVVFWVLLHISGLQAGLIGALVWCYLAIAHRWIRGRALPGILLLGAAMFTTRTTVALAFHSAFVYFLSPTVNAFALGVVFGGSALLGRPLAGRLAKDFVQLPDRVVRKLRIQAMFRHVSLLWATVNVLNGAVALRLLADKHLDTLLLMRSLASPLLTAVAIVASAWLGRKALKREGVHLRLRWNAPAPTPLADAVAEPAVA
jgi:intracellular septation protein A